MGMSNLFIFEGICNNTFFMSPRLLSAFHAGGNRVLFPSVIAPWPKRAIWFVVICGILYVLISPLPELDTPLSGKSALIFFFVFVLVTYALGSLAGFYGRPQTTARGLFLAGRFPDEELRKALLAPQRIATLFVAGQRQW